MAKPRKKAFHALTTLLRTIEANVQNIELVKEMNDLLLKEILLSEKAVLRHKDKLKTFRMELKTKRLSKVEAKKIRIKIQQEERYIKHYNSQLFIWKCFGDGLVYSFLDKFSVKHSYYETSNYSVKPPAGMLNGKLGLAKELSMLRFALKQNIPAVLCDLTNVLRYGDVCLLGGSDPYFIEVKSGNILNQRGKRQAESLRNLMNFLNDDHAENFRNPGVTRRVELSIPERNHLEEMNSCIENAKKTGSSISTPEDGLLYFAAYTDLPEEQLNDALEKFKSPAIFFLNEGNQERTWGIYEPFTLTIRNPEHLFDFISNKLTLIVVLDISVLVKKMVRPGWEIKINDNINANYLVIFNHLETETRVGISSMLIKRIGYEFLSLSWLAESQAPNINEVVKQITEEGTNILAEDLSEEHRALIFETSTKKNVRKPG